MELVASLHHTFKMLFFRRRKYKQFNDSELLALFYNEQQEVIIEVWIERYIHLVLGVCLKYLKQREDAEDTCMQIFSLLPEKLSKNKVENFKAWLHQVTKNECLQVLRKKKINYKEVDEQHYNLVDQSDDFQTNESKLTLMEDALEELKPTQKICIQLFYLEDKSYQEISDELEIPLSKVKSYIQNGKRNLKLYLENYDAFKEAK